MIKNKILKYILPEKTYTINEVDDVTDEIEKSLLEIKEKFDLPTDEIEKTISEYKCRKPIAKMRE